MKTFIKKAILILTLVNFLASCSNDEALQSNGTSPETSLNKNLRIDKAAALKEYEAEFLRESAQLRTYMEDISALPEHEKALLLEAKLQPLARKTVDILAMYDVTPDDIANEYGSASTNEIILAGIVVLEQESHYQTYSSGYTWSEIAGCAAAALGLNVFDEIRNLGARALTRTALLRAFRTLAARTLGPIGLAITVVEFGLCLNE